ncbi:MAG: hypothetical protein ACP5KN_12380 [Armatimonadota bacterium]
MEHLFITRQEPEQNDAASDDDRGRGRPVTPGRTITVTIAGPGGDRHRFRIPAEQIEGQRLPMQRLIEIALEHGDDFDGSVEERARRRTFTHSVRAWLQQAEPEDGVAQYVMMVERDQTGNVPVRPATPVEVGDGLAADQQLTVSFAPYHVGGSMAA